MKKLITDSIMPGIDGTLYIYFNQELLGSVEIANKKEKSPVKSLLLNFLMDDLEKMELQIREHIMETTPLSMFLAVLSVKTTKKIVSEACKGFAFEFLNPSDRSEAIAVSE